MSTDMSKNSYFLKVLCNKLVLSFFEVCCILLNKQLFRPTEKEFNIPTTQDELNEMMSNMRKSGFDKETMMQVFKDRKAKLNEALEDYDKKRESQTNKSPCH